MRFKNFVNESGKPYGEYIFGEFLEFYGRYMEVNTDEETYMFRVVESFVNGDFDRKRKSPRLNDVFKKLMAVKNLYKEVLVPDGLFLFRGITIPLKNFQKLTYISNKSFIFDREAPLLMGDVSLLEDTDKITSWTSSTKIARKFATSITSITRVPIVICKKFPNDKELLFNSKFLNKIALSLPGGIIEDEVVRFSTNKLTDFFINAFDRGAMSEEQIDTFEKRNRR